MPISLIECLYKMLVKVLSRTLKNVLRNVIYDCQKAFFLERQILDGVVVVNEILDMAKRKKQANKNLLKMITFRRTVTSSLIYTIFR